MGGLFGLCVWYFWFEVEGFDFEVLFFVVCF